MSFELRRNQVYLDGRHIGWTARMADGRRVYVSPRNRMGITKDGRGHRMEMYEGYGLAKSVLQWLRANGFSEIHLKISEGTRLISTLDDWDKFGIDYWKRSEFEPQVILQERFMTKRVLSLAQLSR